MTSIQEIRSTIDQRKGQKLQIEKRISQLTESSKKTKKEYKQTEKAKEIIREIGLKTQQQLQVHISSITSLALESIFDNPYQLEVEFIKRRNKTECDLYFTRGGERCKPVDASGGGAVEVAAVALRIASWSMENPHSRNTIILDEPMRFLSKDNQDKASFMIKELSEKLGLQFIIITHERELANHADKLFTVTAKKKKMNGKKYVVSKVTEETQNEKETDINS